MKRLTRQLKRAGRIILFYEKKEYSSLPSFSFFWGSPL